MHPFRIFYRARSRSQRRRCVLCGLSVVVVCVLYLNTLSVDVVNHDTPALLDSIQPRKPMAFKQPDSPKIDDELDFDHDLMPDLAPAILHYIWCGQSRFGYRHYLAIKSANRAVRPDKVFFHYDKLPVLDQEGYYEFFNTTIQEIDHFLPRPLNDMNYTVCPATGTAERYILTLQVLNKFGGIYIPEFSVWVDFPVHLRTSPLVTGVRATSPSDFEDGIIIGKKKGFKMPATSEELLVVLSLGKDLHGGIRPCVSEDEYARDTSGGAICVKIERTIFPKDFWQAKTKLATLVRVVDYGMATIRYNYRLKPAIPKIGHYVCTNCNIGFTGYMSMLSAIFVAGLNKVFVHGVEKPTGIWWDKMQTDPRFIYVYREYPESVYTKDAMTPELALGVMRVAILLKYGGVYQDFSSLWTQKLPESYFGYDAIASADWHLYGDWPDSVNHGILMAKRNSKYLRKINSILQTSKNNPFWYNDHYVSYKMIEKDPSLIWLNRHLQVKCVNHNCHPTWQQNYRSGLLQNKAGASFSWQNDTLNLHWVDGFPELDLDMVKYTSGIAINVCRNIFQAAGVSLHEL